MNIIKTIDLWIEAKVNHYECFNAAFIDGFDHHNIAFDHYKVVKNCNCCFDLKTPSINIRNKHHAIIFYKSNKPVRLLVANRDTDIDNCIFLALNQFYGEGIIKDIFEKNNITREDIDLNEEPIYKASDKDEEIDVGSCDRWSLLYNMLRGYYTESESEYGNFSNDKYYFIPNLLIKLDLTIQDETFEIIHKCAFMNTTKTRVIPIQENSGLTTK